jgi:Ni/Co efflux regulator RcnB
MLLIRLAACVIGASLMAAPATAAQPAANKDDDRKICKAQLETGSLVKKRKQCFTRKEWERIAESQQRGARQLVEDLESRGPQGN